VRYDYEASGTSGDAIEKKEMLNADGNSQI
jgi:hypothetical protein